MSAFAPVTFGSLSTQRRDSDAPGYSASGERSSHGDNLARWADGEMPSIHRSEGFAEDLHESHPLD